MGKTNNPNSWMGYIKATATNECDTSETDIEQIKKMFFGYEHLSAIGMPMAYLIDYSKGEYLTVSGGAKSIVGYEPDDFVRNGLSMVSERFQKDHFRLLDEEIFPARLQLLQTIPYKEHAKYVFTYNFKWKHRKGHYNTLIQRNCFIRSDASGKPLLSFGILLNMTHFAKESPVIEVIEKIDETNTRTPFLERGYYLHKEDKLFSAREKEVLLWLAEGLTSKQVAEKLFISEHTVINHRKNMLIKTGLNNVAALIKFAIAHHLI